MLRIRTTKTASGKTAVQVVERSHQKTKIIKHIGSAESDEELNFLKNQADKYITESAKTSVLFPNLFGVTQPALLSELEQFVNRLSFTKTFHTFAYEFLSFFYGLNGFDSLESPLLRDLAIIRIIEPCSKLRSINLLEKYFAISYGEDFVYENLPKIILLKEKAEKTAIEYAKKTFKFDFSLVFYDVTTLYFETFNQDEDTKDENGEVIKGFKTPGFSKDNKPLQPQIMIGLLVNADGYPLAIEMFPGKTFEGHTIIPAVQKFKKKYQIETLTIVADAGMLSLTNIEKIKDAHLSYIVGARLGNISVKLLEEIAEKLDKTEGKYYTVETERGTLICDYSNKRATKDKSDRKKQLTRAQYQIKNPDKVKRRTRFVIEETKATLKLNEELIKQDELKEGIKGYYTNLELTDKVTEKDVVERYKDLWLIEKSFRIAKSDLEARPIFHHKKESIEAHMLIVFVSLCLAKSIEIKTKYSTKRVKDMIWDILDIAFIDILTGKKFLRRMDDSQNPMAELLKKIKCG